MECPLRGSNVVFSRYQPNFDFSLEWHPNLLLLVVRRYANAMVVRNLEQCRFEMDAELRELIRVVIELSKSKVCEVILPFIILEDMFEISPLNACVAEWTIVEENRSELTDAFFMPVDKNTNSKLSLLRMINGLLKRASQSRYASFCGTLMMWVLLVTP